MPALAEHEKLSPMQATHWQNKAITERKGFTSTDPRPTRVV